MSADVSRIMRSFIHAQPWHSCHARWQTDEDVWDLGSAIIHHDTYSLRRGVSSTYGFPRRFVSSYNVHVIRRKEKGVGLTTWLVCQNPHHFCVWIDGKWMGFILYVRPFTVRSRADLGRSDSHRGWPTIKKGAIFKEFDRWKKDKDFRLNPRVEIRRMDCQIFAEIFE